MNSSLPEKSQLVSDKLPTSQEAVPAYAAAVQTIFASLSLHQGDRIRMLHFPDSDVAAMKTVIKGSWQKGLQGERNYGGSYEYKMYGYPWRGQGSDAITSRILMREVFASLFSQGWILHASTDVSKKEFDKDTMIFRKQQQPPPESEWFAISFNMSDRLRLIGADGGLISDVRELLKHIKLWQNEDWKDKNLNAREFKLWGRPWWASGEETMKTRLLLLRLLELLEARGWSLYASVDQSTAGNDSSETDSWFCVRDKSWVEGSAVFHR
ncbi:hypothetical protein BJ875DRAFT_52611 [Amylocarpus encephaloides]|uniref:Uncharacterized protein n=1 Tax=Amylocarpus encephaloides TaxID=45428 RepID=A0A9P7YGZ9_9HELO|nr:hypothetical protein BJ875DRAFT_52611 [Amylocarpus encephaloides]